MIIEKNIKNSQSSIRVPKCDEMRLGTLINNQLIIVCSCVFVLSGCAYHDEPMPKITEDYSSKVVQPRVSKPSVSRTDIYTNIPRNWLPSPQLKKKWTAIVIHHSGTKKGNAAIFDKWHRESNHWEGIGYDFVIGNGNGSGNGQVEVTFRWRDQIAGAHCGGTPRNWANEDAIGICLVGDFSITAPTSWQMQSLVKLIRFLQRQYSIPKSRIYGHRNTPGYPGKTSCPGNFPMARLKSMLDS